MVTPVVQSWRDVCKILVPDKSEVSNMALLQLLAQVGTHAVPIQSPHSN